MTAKQQLKMAESQIAYWKAVAAEAKREFASKARAKRLPKMRKASKRSVARATNAKAKSGKRAARVVRTSRRGR